jgi:hypothetical protein
MAGASNRFRLVLAGLLVTMVVSAPLAAQGGGTGQGGGMGPGGGMGRRGMGMGGPRSGGFDPVVLDGPPAPDRVDSVMTIDSAQKARYATLYENLMSSTKSERDQIRQTREAFRSGANPDEMQSRRGEMQGAMQTLADRQKSFDTALKDFLNKDQLKQYDSWRDARRKEMRERFNSRRGSPPGEAPPQ